MPIDPQEGIDDWFVPAHPSQWQTGARPRIIVHPKPPSAPPDNPAGADGIDDWFVPGTAPVSADGPDDWYVPTNARADTSYPDDWYVPAPPATPSPGPSAPRAQPDAANPGFRNPATARPDPFAAYWAMIPASRAGAMAWHPPIFPNSAGQFPLPAPAPLNAPRIDPTQGLLGALANLPDTSSAPIFGLFGTLKNPLPGNPAEFRSFQGVGSTSNSGDQPAPASFLQKLANVDSGNRTNQTGLALDQAPAATTTPFSESDTGLAQQISCQGPTCSQGGSFGTTGMYIVSGRRLCRDCAVKFLGIQELPAAEQMKILQNFLR